MSASMIAMRNCLQQEGEIIDVISDRIISLHDILRSIDRGDFAVPPGRRGRKHWRRPRSS